MRGAVSSGAATAWHRGARWANLLARVQVDPIHPTRILLRREDTADRLPGRAEPGVPDADGVAQVVVIGEGPVGRDIAHGIGSGAPELNHAAMYSTSL